MILVVFLVVILVVLVIVLVVILVVILLVLVVVLVVLVVVLTILLIILITILIVICIILIILGGLGAATRYASTGIIVLRLATSDAVGCSAPSLVVDAKSNKNSFNDKWLADHTWVNK